MTKLTKIVATVFCAASLSACAELEDASTTESDLICSDCEVEPPPIGEGGGGGGGSGPILTETMLDRCSGEVIVAWSFDEPFSLAMTGIAVKRVNSTSWTQWSELMPVTSGALRWYCHSTIGNWLDPGTWRIRKLIAGIDCPGNWDTDTSTCGFNASIKITSSALDGWTPERSNCSSATTRYVQARLGTDRRLEIRCYN
jgi:hypothetical protein